MMKFVVLLALCVSLHVGEVVATIPATSSAPGGAPMGVLWTIMGLRGAPGETDSEGVSMDSASDASFADESTRTGTQENAGSYGPENAGSYEPGFGETAWETDERFTSESPKPEECYLACGGGDLRKKKKRRDKKKRPMPQFLRFHFNELREPLVYLQRNLNLRHRNAPVRADAPSQPWFQELRLQFEEIHRKISLFTITDESLNNPPARPFVNLFPKGCNEGMQGMALLASARLPRIPQTRADHETNRLFRTTILKACEDLAWMRFTAFSQCDAASWRIMQKLRLRKKVFKEGAAEIRKATACRKMQIGRAWPLPPLFFENFGEEMMDTGIDKDRDFMAHTNTFKEPTAYWHGEGRAARRCRSLYALRYRQWILLRLLAEGPVTSYRELVDFHGWEWGLSHREVFYVHALLFEAFAEHFIKHQTTITCIEAWPASTRFLNTQHEQMVPDWMVDLLLRDDDLSLRKKQDELIFLKAVHVQIARLTKQFKTFIIKQLIKK